MGIAPIDRIRQLVAERESWTDAKILADLRKLVPLPNESARKQWARDAIWERTYHLIALSDLIAERRLHRGVGLVLDRMPHGDPGETMRGMRHSFEAAVNPEWSILTKICLSRCKSERSGTRLWAVDQLAVLRDRKALPAILRMFDDRDSDVVDTACRAASMTTQEHADLRPRVVTALHALQKRKPRLRAEAQWALDHIAEQEAES